MKTLLCICVFIAMVLAAPADVNVTGNWSGTANVTRPDGTTRENPAPLVLKQNGTEITGTAGSREDQQIPLQKGKIDGDKITLEFQENNLVVKFDLVIAGDRIKGEADILQNGEHRKAKLDLGRK